MLEDPKEDYGDLEAPGTTIMETNTKRSRIC